MDVAIFYMSHVLPEFCQLYQEVANESLHLGLCGDLKELSMMKAILYDLQG